MAEATVRLTEYLRVAVVAAVLADWMVYIKVAYMVASMALLKERSTVLKMVVPTAD